MAYEMIHKALQALSGACDGAIENDKVGFNGVDSQFGKSLAAAPFLSKKQATYGYKMLRKYRKQLAGYGIEFDKIENPDTVACNKWENPMGYSKKQDAQGETYVVCEIVNIPVEHQDSLILNRVGDTVYLHKDQHGYNIFNESGYPILVEMESEELKSILKSRRDDNGNLVKVEMSSR